MTLTNINNQNDINDFDNKIKINNLISIFDDVLEQFFIFELISFDTSNNTITYRKSNNIENFMITKTNNTSNPIILKSVDNVRESIRFDIIDFQSDDSDDITDFIINNDGEFRSNTIKYKIKVLKN